mmetsp:Transcript_3991/g.7121  ORF Transcript_3991/g.7121 Transcript_3991/m.7121 type:complete len:109 (-) Transcript_3991:291-617(-)|eukprot:CAMPEP_0201903618 /NCGR_PEP_ID=MMETSP0902-20130614/55568_1 /ASSEMBLY_ACC=CAM_ASM_000551 /TAXON_ID=420261 /ORGANISM="Thalassiosira antarctica, Strain CCMP982" /LENGTH=108 /DNA_ID=CAMNT_0048437671 /DNA_START=596 /DNA_END=922 /DNA_ORIENTATION=+
MISRTFLLLAAAAIGSTTAFTAQPTGVTTRAATQLSMIPDKEFENKLKTDSQLKDAKRASILECDDTECAQIQCEQDNRGNWVCEGGLEGEDRKTTKTVLMTVQDDDE